MRSSHILSAALIGAIGAACNGKTTSSDADGGPGQNAPDCPSNAPTQESSCSHENLLCEYGTDFDPKCNSVAVCSGGRWTSPIYYGGTKDCPSKPLPNTIPNPSECAATPSGVPVDTMCSTKLTCAYDGSTCFCGSWCSSYPIQMPPCDGGIMPNCCDMTVKWHCFGGPPYCKAPRPRIGSACTNEGDKCATGPAVECGQSVISCQKGVWNEVNTSCPISTRRMKKDIAYLDRQDEERLREELLDVHLATYRYRSGDDAPHLGFIIEDMPIDSPAVMPSREHVDLYGYTSMAIATIQRQQSQIDDLERRLTDLETRCPPPKSKRAK